MHGIVIVNKEKGYTSRDVVNVLNKEWNIKKIGHTGTLDPIATGVLVMCVGKYTKLVDKITSYDKEYIATIKLGIKTDTLDITGEVLENETPKIINEELLIKTLNSFLGKSMQEVPKFSAIKIDGKKLYEYARNEEEIVLPKREIEIKEIELLKNTKEEIAFKTVVSKGTYIRSLIRDICKKLDCLGTMSSLIRTRQGIFKIEDAHTLDSIKNKDFKVLDITDIFPYPHYKLNENEYFKVQNGNPLVIENNEPYLILEYNDRVVAIYEKNNDIYKTYFRL